MLSHQSEDSEIDQQYHKQALLNGYDQNKNIDLIRTQISSKSIWQCFPNQQLHNKLNILEKNFLNINNKLNFKQNIDKCQAYSVLQVRVKKNPYLTRDVRQKLQHFMDRYSQAHESNIDKRSQIQSLKKQLNYMMKKTQKLTKELDFQSNELLKIKENNRKVKKTEQKIDVKLKLLWG